MLTLLLEEMKVVLPVYEHNAYWLHPENLLLANLADENAATRADAVDKIIKIRHPIAIPEVREREREREREKERER